MNDLKPFKHGQEGTHYACAEIANADAPTTCCECTGHECKEAVSEMEATDWKKLINKPYHEWKNDEDVITRTVYFISYLSPHNLWKGYKAIQDLLKKRDEQYAMEISAYKSNEEQRMTVFKAGLIKEIEGMKKKMCCDECDSFDDKNQTLSHVIERIKKYEK